MKRAVIVLLAAALMIVSFSIPATANTGNVFLRNRTAGRKVALTFDDGPHPIYTPRILEILDEFGITATFFVVGQNVENYPDAFKAILDSGCEIGNHTYSHRNVGRMSDGEILSEIEATEAAVAKICDRKLTLLRPPEGSLGGPLERVSLDKGYDVILWSIDTLDWAHTPSDKIVAKVIGNLCGGDIILMHDYVSGNNTTCDALRKLIPELKKRGYEFVTVSELICQE